MLRYMAKRLVTTVPVVLGVTIVTFVLTQVLPNDPAVILAGDTASDEVIQAIRERHGLDRPLLVQYGLYISLLLRGDLGTSMFTGSPVASDLVRYFMGTAELATAAIMLSVLIGIPLGVIAATRSGSLWDHLSRVIATFGSATPVFWLALMLVALFAVRLGMFPIAGQFTIGTQLPPTVTHSLVVDSILARRWDVLTDTLRHLALPAATLGVMGAGLITRVMRSSMLEVLNEEYITTARAKGMSEARVTYVHALRNAILPAVTITGLTYGALLGGAVLTESIFGWPGLGRYALSSIFRLDFPALMGVVIVMTLATVVVNLVVDLLYIFLNPLVKY